MYHELMVWSRGIIWTRKRDVSSCIAAAARTLGFYADNVSDYVDDPDQATGPVKLPRPQVRPVRRLPHRGPVVYENPRPDWVVLVEETTSRRSTSSAARPTVPGCWSSTPRATLVLPVAIPPPLNPVLNRTDVP